MPCRFPDPHPRGKLRGLAGGSPGPHPGVCVCGLQAHTQRGVSRPTPREGLQPHTQGERVSRLTPGGGADPPRLLLWAVRILLECILVVDLIGKCNVAISNDLGCDVSLSNGMMSRLGLNFILLITTDQIEVTFG